MQYLLDFLQTNPINKTKIYPFLRCTKEEALILRYFCQEILKGNDEIICLDIINSLFAPNNDEEILKFLPLFKNLLDLGWLTQNIFLKNLSNEILFLELLNSAFSLSSSFLKLIQEGGIYPKLPKIIPYSDHLDYLKDQFLVIDLLSSLVPYKKDTLSSPLLEKGKQKIKSLQERIKQKLELTKDKPALEILFKEYNLNLQEKIIFLALLKEEYSGKGVSYCAVCDAAFFKDEDVAVIGGGDSAIEEGIYLSQLAKSVTVIHRRDQLRAQPTLQKRAFANKKMHFIWNAQTEEILGDDMKVTGVKYRDKETGAEKEIPVAGVFIYVGVLPQTEPFKDLGILDDHGWIVTDDHMETKVPGIFALGDVRQKDLRQIANAVGEGSVGGQAAYNYYQDLQDKKN